MGTTTTTGLYRSRWAALGAAVAVSLGAGGIGLAGASTSTGEQPVTFAVSPERVVDTRDDLGLVGPIAGGQQRKVQITGEVAVASGGTKTVVPSDAAAVIVNVTAVDPPGPGFLALRPGGSSGTPTTSTVNFTAAGVVEPNAATVALGPGGRIDVFALLSVPGTVDVLIDIVGYTIDHQHDDRYYTEAEVDALLAAAPGRMEYLSIASNGAVRTISTSPGLQATTVFRPPMTPTGHYCIDIPDDRYEPDGTMATIQSAVSANFSGPDTIRLVSSLNGRCQTLGAEIEVRTASDAGTAEDGFFTLAIPTK